MPYDFPVPGTSRCPSCGKSKYRDVPRAEWTRTPWEIGGGCLVVWDCEEET